MSWIDELESKVRSGVTSATKHRTPADLAKAIEPTHVDRPHLTYLSNQLTKAVKDVENGQSRWITVSMPPRSGKSSLTSIWLPTWLMQNHPDWKVGLISHSPTLSSSWGRQVRRVIEQFPQIGVKLASDAGAVTDWQTTEGGGVISRSVGQSTTGLGFKVLLLDDVVKDFAAAHSASNREAVWNWWTANSRTRLEPPSLVISIATRWHEDDFIGRLLSSESDGDPDEWEQITFPAIATVDDDVLGREVGDPLYTPLLDETREEALVRWEETKIGVGTYAWNALYQQEPSPPGGAIVHREWFQYYDVPPNLGDLEMIIQSWDLTFDNTEGSDFVVGQVWGRQAARYYLLDQVRARMSFTESIAAIRTLSAKWPMARLKLVENAANGPAMISTLKRSVAGLVPVKPTKSKVDRLRGVTPLYEAGNVWVPSPKLAPWVHDYVEELVAFPNGVNDDQTDGSTQALDRMSAATGGATVTVNSF